MTKTLSPNARRLIEEARVDFERPTRLERERLKRDVLAAMDAVGAGAATLSTATSVAASSAGAPGAGAAAAVAGGPSVAASSAGASMGAGVVASLAKGTVLVWFASGFAVGVGGLGAATMLGNGGHAESGRAPADHDVVAHTAAARDGAAAPALGGRRAPVAAQFAEQRREAEGDTRGGIHATQPLPLREARNSVSERPEPAGTDVAIPAPATPSLDAELRVLERAQAALRAGSGQRALELLESHTPPSEALENERLTVQVLAACQVGDRPRARRAADRLLIQAPQSPLATRVRASCAFATEAPAPEKSR